VGWGFVFEIRADRLQAFEVTRTTCVKSFEAKRSNSIARSGFEASFRAPHRDAFHLVAGADNDHKRIIGLAELAGMAIERLPQLPRVCAPPTASTPAGNFEVFAQTFAEQYIAFDLRGLDWDEAVKRGRAKVTSETTPAQLFDILVEMIRPLSDIHTEIGARSLRRTYDAPFRPGTGEVGSGDIERFAKQGRRELAAITDHTYLHRPPVRLCHGQWEYQLLDGGIGYLRILSFGDYSKRGGLNGSLKALNTALDRILGDSTLRALIIDARLSFGGDDKLGLAIASRLTQREYVAYSIQARMDDRYTTAEAVMVRPRETAAIRRPCRGVDRPHHDERGRNIHAGVDGTDACDRTDRQQHTRRVLRRSRPAASERMDVRTAECRVPASGWQGVRRSGGPAGCTRAGVCERGSSSRP
jgi:hypothetical protein